MSIQRQDLARFAAFRRGADDALFFHHVNHIIHHADEGSSKLWPSVIAELGREGWELVTVETGALYFKRAITLR